MRSFDAAMLTELAKAQAVFAWTVELHLTSYDYRWVNLDIPLYLAPTWGVGATAQFFPYAVEVGQITNSPGLGPSTVSIVIANADHVARAIFLNEETRGRDAAIGFVALDGDTGEVLSSHAIWRGIVSTYRIDDTNITVTLVNELIRWHRKHLRQCSMTCRWAFKGDECAYAGAETWCDQSHSRCVALGNSDSFGGFRFLEDIMERKVRWGRQD